MGMVGRPAQVDERPCQYSRRKCHVPPRGGKRDTTTPGLASLAGLVPIVRLAQGNGHARPGCRGLAERALAPHKRCPDEAIHTRAPSSASATSGWLSRTGPRTVHGVLFTESPPIPAKHDRFAAWPGH